MVDIVSQVVEDVAGDVDDRDFYGGGVWIHDGNGLRLVESRINIFLYDYGKRMFP